MTPDRLGFLKADGAAITQSDKTHIGLVTEKSVQERDFIRGEPLMHKGRLYMSLEPLWRDYVVSGENPTGSLYFLQDGELFMQGKCEYYIAECTHQRPVSESFEAAFARTVSSALTRLQRLQR